MKTDIQTADDIKTLVNSFYEKVKQDEALHYFFTDVVKVDWEKHLPVMYRFWDNIVFHTGSYAGNPMEVHQHLHNKCHLHKLHFDRWITLFNETVDELFEGEKAFQIKQRALSIATVMQIKIADMPREESVY
ncbi:MAG: group III truncated hemoglobin [Chitinophagaceae bacterium]|jgi:hemoglobin